MSMEKMRNNVSLSVLMVIASVHLMCIPRNISSSDSEMLAGNKKKYIVDNMNDPTCMNNIYEKLKNVESVHIDITQNINSIYVDNKLYSTINDDLSDLFKILKWRIVPLNKLYSSNDILDVQLEFTGKPINAAYYIQSDHDLRKSKLSDDSRFAGYYATGFELQINISLKINNEIIADGVFRSILKPQKNVTDILAKWFSMNQDKLSEMAYEVSCDYDIGKCWVNIVHGIRGYEGLFFCLLSPRFSVPSIDKLRENSNDAMRYALNALENAGPIGPELRNKIDYEWERLRKILYPTPKAAWPKKLVDRDWRTQYEQITWVTRSWFEEKKGEYVSESKYEYRNARTERDIKSTAGIKKQILEVETLPSDVKQLLSVIVLRELSGTNIGANPVQWKQWLDLH